MPKRLTTEEFISKAREIHGDKYDYSKTEYVNNTSKVCIICPEHGEFWQKPFIHLDGSGCLKCGKIRNINRRTCSQLDFIVKAQKIHKNKYDYSKVKYVNSKIKVCIICPEHGEFWQTPNNHLKGQGCPNCKRNAKYSAIGFITKARDIHKNKYDYSKVEYVNSKTKVCVTCVKHGEFWITPNSHLNGQGCRKCGLIERGIKKRDNENDFILKSILKHNNKYDYSKIMYIHNKISVCIICPEHGEFWQTPHDHLQGCGCPKCNSSHLETEIRNLLKTNHISFEEQKKFSWLGNLRLDFYLTDYNVAIECQGIQHFEPIEYFGGDECFECSQQRDKIKKQLCEQNGIKLLYYANYEYDFPYEVITENNALIEKINECALIK